MSVFRALAAIHFALYLTALSLAGATIVLHILMEYDWMKSAGYGTLMVGGFWLSQGLAVLINRAMGYTGKSRSGSFD
ncbi:MAG: hypothetical protein V4671_19210 [Armatimonadota bacterium]